MDFGGADWKIDLRLRPSRDDALAAILGLTMHSDVEAALARCTTLMMFLALALFDDETRGSHVLTSVNTPVGSRVRLLRSSWSPRWVRPPGWQRIVPRTNP